jgi:hypothetical protein
LFQYIDLSASTFKPLVWQVTTIEALPDGILSPMLNVARELAPAGA